MGIVEHASGNTTVTTNYRCRVCGYEGVDGHTYLATESGFHRPIVYGRFAMFPWWCREHGEEAMEVVGD